MGHPGSTEIVPVFAPQLVGEPVLADGHMNASRLKKPAFGVEFNRAIHLHRPYKQ